MTHTSGSTGDQDASPAGEEPRSEPGDAAPGRALEAAHLHAGTLPVGDQLAGGGSQRGKIRLGGQRRQAGDELVSDRRLCVLEGKGNDELASAAADLGRAGQNRGVRDIDARVKEKLRMRVVPIGRRRPHCLSNITGTGRR